MFWVLYKVVVCSSDGIVRETSYYQCYCSEKYHSAIPKDKVSIKRTRNGASDR